MAPVTGAPYHSDSGGSVSSKVASSSDTITNTVFGLCAVVIGALTIWQGRRVWRLWYMARSTGPVPRGDSGYELPGSITLPRVDHPAGIGPGSTTPILPLDNPPLSPIAPYTTALGIPDEPPTIHRALETSSQALAGSDSAPNTAGTPHPDVRALAYKAGPSADGSAERLTSIAIQHANSARPSFPRRCSAPTRIKSATPLGVSHAALDDKHPGA